MEVLSYDPARRLFFIHHWGWGSCSGCDPWESRLYPFEEEQLSEESLEDREEDREEEVRQEVEQRGVSLTAWELVSYGRLGNSPLHQAICFLFDRGPRPDNEDEWEPPAYCYVAPEDFGSSPALSVEQYALQQHNEQEETCFPLGDRLRFH